MKFFDYREAFDRNLGWLTDWEQSILRNKRVAVAGTGGVGGLHILTLARLGIGALTISDIDSYELANFNRQVGATLSTLDRPKVEVMAEMVRDINPQIDIRIFPGGIDETNFDEFLQDVDLFIDGFDFFVLDIRALVFARCAELDIPAITAGPIGMGVAYLNFLPGRMPFEDYFRFEGCSREQRYVNFLVGLTPRAPHRRYLVDPSRLDLARQRGPSTGMACQLCAGVLVTEAVKILLERGPVRAAPCYQLFDAYLGRFYSGRIPFGNNHPLQIIKRRMGYRMLKKMHHKPMLAAPVSVQSGSEIRRILDLARWAPSGDNTQPWRFRLQDDDTVLIDITDQAGSNVYEFNGAQPTLLSAGFLLETLALAATTVQRSMSWDCHQDSEHVHSITVRLAKDTAIERDPLSDFIVSRSVDRGRYRTTRLSDRQKRELEACLGDQLSVRWFTTRAEKLQVARVNALATDIRLRIPEAYAVHRQMLDWENSHSATGIPGAAVGLDPATLKLMRWVMASWRRVAFMNRYLGGTLMPRLQLDWIPGMSCAAHFAISHAQPLKTEQEGSRTADDTVLLLNIGRSLQRFWLVAAKLGLVLQPALAPLCFGYYGRHQIEFTEDRAAQQKASKLDAGLNRLHTGYRANTLVFMGRIGQPQSRAAKARSSRMPLQQLLLNTAADGDRQQARDRVPETRKLA